MNKCDTNKEQHILIFGSLLLGVYFSALLWGFWTHHLAALGINATVYCLLFCLLIYFFKQELFAEWRATWIWFAPLFFVSLSYMLYENYFITLIHFIFLPIASGFVLMLLATKDERKIFSRLAMVIVLMAGTLLSPFFYLLKAIENHCSSLMAMTGVRLRNHEICMSVVKGLILFLALAVMLIIPLLSGADTQFASIFHNLFRNFLEFFDFLFSKELIHRGVMAGFISIAAASCILSWAKPCVLMDQQEDTVDSIAAGVVLGGILLIYLLFIVLQFDRFLLTSLPLEFEATEQYVKTGFWQLLLLSAMNIILIFSYFKRTNKYVQWLLIAFLLASMFLLFSAAHRMFFYVLYYGLSHEKFYASYTVIYCMILFALMLYALIRSDAFFVLRNATLLLLWMYGTVALFPVEYTIARMNLTLSTRDDARLYLSELRMLSADALPFVRSHMQEFYDRKPSAKRWRHVEKWVRKTEESLSEKRLYEHTLTSLR